MKVFRSNKLYILFMIKILPHSPFVFSLIPIKIMQICHFDFSTYFPHYFLLFISKIHTYIIFCFVFFLMWSLLPFFWVKLFSAYFFYFFYSQIQSLRLLLFLFFFFFHKLIVYDGFLFFFLFPFNSPTQSNSIRHH